MQTLLRTTGNFIKRETVLSAAILLAAISACFVLPDSRYPDYIDFRTLAILFSLMAVMAGLRRQNVFDALGRLLLSRTGSLSQVVLVLVLLCFFFSMVITNDVALITFVPFTFTVLTMMGETARHKLLLPVVCMQTIAANLGSMLTPIGNPQNLYLYARGGMTMGGFVGLMLPYTALSLLLLLLWCGLLCRGKSRLLPADTRWNAAPGFDGDRRIVLLYLALFVLCLLTVLRLIPCGAVLLIVLAAVLTFDRKDITQVDYSLLLTFVAFFIFIGNLGRIEVFSDWLGKLLAGREVLTAVLASQVTSNVPAALLLSGFTAKVPELIVGTNLGGLGTLIASMASLISYRQIACGDSGEKGAYFRLFTVSNVIFLAILLLFRQCLLYL